MKKKVLWIFLLQGTIFCSSVFCAVNPGVPRDSNNNNTEGYDGTRVEAQLVVQLKENAEAIHFIRDNNDPRVITKTYLIKHVDIYNFRDYLRQMVQSKRVGNTALIQQYPGNTQSSVTVDGSNKLNYRFQINEATISASKACFFRR